MASKVECNTEQLQVGENIRTKINSDYDDMASNTASNIKKIINDGLENKVSFANTIDLTTLDSCAEDFTTRMTDIGTLATEMYEIAERYNSGKLDGTGMSAENLFEQYAKSYLNSVYPDTATRVISTIGMGLAQFGEGFLDFFEGIGDAAITLAAGACKIFGSNETAQSLKEFAAKNLVDDTIENTEIYKYIEKTSYFDSDSLYAKIFHTAGTLTAAAVTTKGVVSVISDGAKVAEAKNIVTTAKEVETEEEAITTAKEVLQSHKNLKNITSVGTNYISSAGKNTASQLADGRGLKVALGIGLASATVDATINQIAKGTGSTIGSKISSEVFQTAEKEGEEVVEETLSKTVKDTTTTSIKNSSIEQFTSSASKEDSHVTKDEDGNLTYTDSADELDDAGSIVTENIDQADAEKLGLKAADKAIATVVEDIIK